MMILRSSPASPFVRKVRIALSLLGMTEKVDIVAADTNEENSLLRRENPVGKIPALILGDGKAIYDSLVILDYLDRLAGGGKLFPPGEARTDALLLHALASGLTDAALLLVYEGRYREPEKREPKWISMQQGKVDRALDALEASPPPIPAMPHAGTIATACALGYLDLRFEGKWRAGRPKLAAWLDEFAQKVPAFEETRFRG